MALRALSDLLAFDVTQLSVGGAAGTRIRLASGLVLALVVTVGCDDPPRPVVTIPRASETSATPQAIAETGESTQVDAESPEPEPEQDQYVVYFGSFRDYLAASTYSESLRSAGLFDLNITRAKAGGEMVVTGPMNQSDADELAARLRGRAISVQRLERLSENYDFLIQE